MNFDLISLRSLRCDFELFAHLWIEGCDLRGRRAISTAQVVENLDFLCGRIEQLSVMLFTGLRVDLPLQLRIGSVFEGVAYWLARVWVYLKREPTLHR